MKILQAIYQFQTGGGSLKVALDLAAAARAAGHEVRVLAKDMPISAAQGAERFFSGNKPWDWWRLGQQIWQERYDLVHVHDRYCSLLVSLIPQAPASVQTNHLAYRTRRRLTRFADCVVGCSEAMDQHHANYFGLPASRRALIRNGSHFRRPDSEKVQHLQQTLPLQAQGRKICLTVARLSAQKGHTNLLAAIAQLPPDLRQTWCFALAGGGELETQLRTQAAQLGILGDLVFLGQTQDVPEWLALAEVFVLPSLYEGLPLALIEAMAAGLACVATAVDGNLELLHPDQNGLLCRPADPDHLAQALQTLLENQALRTRLGTQAQADYWRYWTFERTWQEYASLYQQLSQSSLAHEQLPASY